MGQTFSLLSLQFFVFRFTFFFFFYFFFFHIDFCSLSFNRFLKMTLIVVISVLASALMTMGTNSAAAYDYGPGQLIVKQPEFAPGFEPKPGMTYPPVKWECPWHFSCANPENQNRKTTCCDNDCQCVRIGKKLEKKENKLAQLLKERRRIRQ